MKTNEASKTEQSQTLIEEFPQLLDAPNLLINIDSDVKMKEIKINPPIGGTHCWVCLRHEIEELIEMLGDENWQVRAEATAKLGKIGQHAVPPLIKALKDKDENVRCGAAEALGKIGPAADDAESALIYDIDSSDECRKVADEALEKIILIDKSDSLIKKYVESLLKGSKQVELPEEKKVKADKPVPLSAEESKISNLWKNPEVSNVIKGLEDDDPKVREVAEWVIIEMGGSNAGSKYKDAVPALVKNLEDQNAGVRMRAAQALGYIGPAAEDAVPKLEKMQKSDSDKGCRDAATAALEKIQEKSGE